MARYTGPQCRLCRADKKKLFLKGERCFTIKCPVTKKRNPPGKGPRTRQKKLSDYIEAYIFIMFQRYKSESLSLG